MATTELTGRPLALPRLTFPRELRRAYAMAYLACIGGLLAVALLFGLVHPLLHVVTPYLPFNVKTKPHDTLPPNFWTTAKLWFNNARVALGPVAIAFAVSQSKRPLRTLAAMLMWAIVAINIVTTGIGLGAVGLAAIPYLPHAPFELAAFSMLPVTWRAVAGRRLQGRPLFGVLALTAGLLLVAACLETWAVPLWH